MFVYCGSCVVSLPARFARSMCQETVSTSGRRVLEQGEQLVCQATAPTVTAANPPVTVNNDRIPRLSSLVISPRDIARQEVLGCVVGLVVRDGTRRCVRRDDCRLKRSRAHPAQRSYKRKRRGKTILPRL